MSILKEFRRIVIDGKKYFWRFTYSNKKDRNYSYLLVTSDVGINAELLIRFSLRNHSVDHQMLKNGFYVLRDGTQKMISLTQPQVVAEIITYANRNNVIDFEKKRGIVLDNGEELLKEMGYHF